MKEQQWVVVADSPFIPARGGGEREHLGFVRATAAAGWLAALVIPTAEAVDRSAYLDEVGEVPVILTRRRTSPLLLAHPRYPYVVASRPARAGLAEQVRAAAGHVTGVVTYSYKSRLIGQVLAAHFGVPMILRQHNREGDYHRSLAAGQSGVRRVVMSWEAARIGRDEARLDRANSIRAIADISQADAQARRAAGARNVIHVPPFAYDPALAGQRHPPSTDDIDRVLFLGALDVPTNTTALGWFLSQVWPIVVAQAPRTQLDVVGRNPSAALRTQLAKAANVSLHADVPSLTPFLNRATVAVNPAITGSGVNIKVIDYLQAGLPLISTSLATAGLPLIAGEDLEVADDPRAFAASIVGLLADPARRELLARVGQAHLDDLLNPRKNLARLADAFDARS